VDHHLADGELFMAETEHDAYLDTAAVDGDCGRRKGSGALAPGRQVWRPEAPCPDGPAAPSGR